MYWLRSSNHKSTTILPGASIIWLLRREEQCDKGPDCGHAAARRNLHFWTPLRCDSFGVLILSLMGEVFPITARPIWTFRPLALIVCKKVKSLIPEFWRTWADVLRTWFQILIIVVPRVSELDKMRRILPVARRCVRTWVTRWRCSVYKKYVSQMSMSPKCLATVQRWCVRYAARGFEIGSDLRHHHRGCKEYRSYWWMLRWW